MIEARLEFELLDPISITSPSDLVPPALAVTGDDGVVAEEEEGAGEERDERDHERREVR